MSCFEASSNNNSSLQVSLVEVKINTNGSEAVFSFDGSNMYDANKISEDAKESNTSFNYSGRHDHGELPTLLNTDSDNNTNGDGSCSKTNHYLRLIGAVQEAKYTIDSYITDDMKKQSENVSNVIIKDDDAKTNNEISNTIHSEDMDTDPSESSESSESGDLNMPPKKMNRIE